MTSGRKAVPSTSRQNMREQPHCTICWICWGDAQKVEDSAKEETLIGRGAAALTMDLDYTGEEQVQLKVYSQSYLPGIAQSYLLIQTAEGNDVQNYVLPQDDYSLLTDWMQEVQR